MFKRVVIWVFILIANVILLTHAVLPHHHHENQVCFILSHCHANGHASDSGLGNEPGNEHKGDTQDCVLRQIVALPDKASIRSSDMRVETFEILSGDVVLSLDHLLDVPSRNLVSLDQPVKAFSFPNFVSSSLGLRAPPAV